MNIAVDEFNNKARRLRLIPPSAEFAEGVDMEMNASLSAEESNRYEIIIRVSKQTTLVLCRSFLFLSQGRGRNYNLYEAQA